jgi:uncharacterized protein YigA (DUF484 family)
VGDLPSRLCLLNKEADSERIDLIKSFVDLQSNNTVAYTNPKQKIRRRRDELLKLNNMQRQTIEFLEVQLEQARKRIKPVNRESRECIRPAQDNTRMRYYIRRGE